MAFSACLFLAAYFNCRQFFIEWNEWRVLGFGDDVGTNRLFTVKTVHTV